MKVLVNNLPKIKLESLLKRRKLSMKVFLEEMGITTYDSLINRCDRIGVQPPTYDEFLSLVPEVTTNNPLEGVIVVEPPPLVKELTGETIQDDLQPVIQLAEPTAEITDVQLSEEAISQNENNIADELGGSEYQTESSTTIQTLNNSQKRNIKKNR